MLTGRFGPYEILAPLGAGGMGEVYRARDTRLKREIAIKILPPEVLENPERQKKFQREAQAASALNHPNILVIHDFGTENQTPYIVSEIIEGESLRKLIQKGVVPLKRFLEIAVQIADGLAAAHAAGIVHRDLKPENIMITPQGRVKVLDFGLAKLYSRVGSEEDETLTATRAGTIQGTVPYMSPEQAAGQSVDFQSDQFSFGLILYEMATGKRAFQRENASQTLAAILAEEPAPIASLNPRLPAPVKWLIERCLNKEPRQRYDSTTDLYRHLKDLLDHLSETNSTEAASALKPVSSKTRFVVGAALALAMLAMAAAGFLAGKKQIQPKSQPTYQLLTFQSGEVSAARFLPDGNTIVYSASFHGNPMQIYSTRAQSPESQLIPTPPAKLLSVSTKGELAIRLLSNSRLAVVPLSGGTPREIAEDVEFADWSPDGQSMAAIRRIGTKRRVEYPLGKMIYETSGDIGDLRISRDGKHVLINDNLDVLGPWKIFILDRAGKKKDLRTSSNAGIVWSPNGSGIISMYGNEGEAGVSYSSLHSIDLDAKDQPLTSYDGAMALYDISPQGQALMARFSGRNESRGYFPGEAEERDVSVLDGSYAAGISDDGHTLLINEYGAGGGSDGAMYLRRSDGSIIRLGAGLGCALSYDGRWVAALIHLADADRTVATLLPTGPGSSIRLKPGPIVEYKWWGAFTRDGKSVIHSAREKDRGWRLYVQDISDGEPHPFSAEGVLLPQASHPVSPDDSLVVGIAPDQKHYLYPLKKGEILPVAGLEKGDRFLRWSDDGHSIFVTDQSYNYEERKLPAKIYKVDTRTGKRILWKEIVPPDRSGVTGLGIIQLTPDGKTYFYGYVRRSSQLYLVKNLF